MCVCVHVCARARLEIGSPVGQAKGDGDLDQGVALIRSTDGLDVRNGRKKNQG